MFTGIVKELGSVVERSGGDSGIRLAIAAPQTAAGVTIGDSVAVNGVCLTVVGVADGVVAFDAVPETLSRTSLGRLEQRAQVNLEPALRAGDPLGGHVVQGHVDGLARLRSVEPEGDGRRLWLDVPAHLLRYVVEKGSVTVDGVALTVAELDDEGFAVALIPHTVAVTTLGKLSEGDAVNLEVDVLAKYVERLTVTMKTP